MMFCDRRRDVHRLVRLLARTESQIVTGVCDPAAGLVKTAGLGEVSGNFFSRFGRGARSWNSPNAALPNRRRGLRPPKG